MGISIRDSGDSDTGAGSSAPADPARASSFFDYARFLQNVRRDYDRAEEMWQRAIEANPKKVILGVSWVISGGRYGDGPLPWGIMGVKDISP